MCKSFNVFTRINQLFTCGKCYKKNWRSKLFNHYKNIFSKQGCHDVHAFITTQQMHLDVNAPLCHINIRSTLVNLGSKALSGYLEHVYGRSKLDPF
jgi:hypothetical protein